MERAGYRLMYTANGGGMEHRYVKILSAILLTVAVFVPGLTAADIRINCGGYDYVDSIGNTWQADTYFTGGSVVNTGHPIYNTVDDTLYEYLRRWQYTTGGYHIPVSNGSYEVVFYFAAVISPGPTNFDISIEGDKKLSGLNPYGASGGMYYPITYDAYCVVNDGYLDIDFPAASYVSAIYVTDNFNTPTATPTSTASPTITQTATITPTFINVNIPLADALDNSYPVWSTGGDAVWYGEDGDFYYGGSAAQNGLLTAEGQESYVEASFVGPASIGFIYKLNSAADTINNDVLRVYVDSNLWMTNSYPGYNTYISTGGAVVNAGPHTVRWTYSKGAIAGSPHDDCARLDKVAIYHMTSTCTWTVSPTPTMTATETSTATATVTRTATLTRTPQPTHTETGTVTVNPTASPVPTIGDRPFAYPVPAYSGNTLTFAFSADAGSPYEVRVYNFAGSLVARVTGIAGAQGRNTAEMDTGKFAGGPYYFIVVEKPGATDEKRSRVSSFVVKK